MGLEFREVTPSNWKKIKPKVKHDQKRFVSSYTATLARAYVYRNENSVVWAIYRNGEPIGLLMHRDYMNDLGERLCILDQFFIDRNYQGQGFGKEAMKLWLANISKVNKYSAVELCFIEGDKIAESLYKSLGFVRKPEEDDGDELVMHYCLH